MCKIPDMALAERGTVLHKFTCNPTGGTTVPRPLSWLSWINLSREDAGSATGGELVPSPSRGDGALLVNTRIRSM